jgi:hypothetical protein
MSIIAASWAAVRPGPMSELGQKRKWGDANATSDLPLKADIKRTSREVRKVPEAAIEPDLRPALAKPRFR